MNKTPQPVERTSFTPREIAERNGISVWSVYQAIKTGRLGSCNLGIGKRGSMRVTLEQEQEWHRNCQIKKENAKHV